MPNTRTVPRATYAMSTASETASLHVPLVQLAGVLADLLGQEREAAPQRFKDDVFALVGHGRQSETLVEGVDAVAQPGHRVHEVAPLYLHLHPHPLGPTVQGPSRAIVSEQESRRKRPRRSTSGAPNSPRYCTTFKIPLHQQHLLTRISTWRGCIILSETVPKSGKFLAVPSTLVKIR